MSLLLCGLAARRVQAQEPSAPPPPEQSTAANDWLTREKLLGDWGGTRTELGNRAILKPAVTLGLIESTEDGFFDNGATFMWDVRLPIKPFSLPGQYTVGGELSSITATSLDQSPWGFSISVGR